MEEYPKMLYKTGTQIDWEGQSLDVITVADANEEAAASDYKTAEALLKPEKSKK